MDECNWLSMEDIFPELDLKNYDWPSNNRRKMAWWPVYRGRTIRRWMHIHGRSCSISEN